MPFLLKNFTKNSPLLILAIYLFLAPFLRLLTPSLGQKLFLLLPIFLFVPFVFQSKRNYLNPRISLFSFSILFLFTLSTLYSVSINASINQLIRWVAILATLSLLSSQASQKSTRQLIIFIITLGTIFSLTWLVLVATGYNHNSGSNFFSLSAGHNPFSNYLVLTLSLALSLWIDKHSFRKSTPLKLAIAVMITALIFTLARGSYLAIIVFILTYSLLFGLPFRFKRKTIFFFSLLATLGLFVLGVGLKTDINPPFSQLDKRNLVNLSQQPLNFLTRLDYWRDAWDTFLKYPLLGQGLATFDYDGQFGYKGQNVLLKLLVWFDISYRLYLKFKLS